VQGLIFPAQFGIIPLGWQTKPASANALPLPPDSHGNDLYPEQEVPEDAKAAR
jgi:hypothetical protein